jgi:hypothetical protein
MLLCLGGCVSYRPAPLSVSITSVPAGADVQLRCPNVDVQHGITPARFRIPQYATPCALRLSREGYRDKQLDLTLEMLQTRAPVRVGPPPKPIHFTDEATPFSLLGALIVRSLENLGTRIAERATTAAIPDSRIEVVLEPALP